jgi:sugar phosphate permease
MPHVTACYLCLKLTRYVFILWLPMYFHSLGYTVKIAGFLATAFEVGNAVGTALNGVVINRYFRGRKVKMVACQTGALVLCVLVFVAASAGRVSLLSAYSSALIIFVAGLCEPGFVISGPIAAELGEHGGRNAQAALAGIINGLGGLGAVVQGPLVGFAVARWGWSGVFYAVASLCALGVAVLVPAVRMEEDAMVARAAAVGKLADAAADAPPSVDSGAKAADAHG